MLSLVQIEGWTLAAGGFDDGRARVLDIELAQHLEFAEPLAVRRLIKSLRTAGKLNDVAVVHVPSKTSGGRPATEFWLTEAQALKVVAKSETARADAILDELIRVFLLLRDHAKQAPPPVNFDASALERLERRFDALLETVSTVMKTVSALAGATIPPHEACTLLREVREIATLKVTRGIAKNENSARRQIYNRLSGALGWFGTGRNWRALPLHKLPDAKALIAEMRRELGWTPPPPTTPQQLSLLPGGKA
jgi:hypothetical protein